ncbi:MAG: DNA mismatch repair protein MutS [Chitinophagaceae bacterium]|nr:MAG: DNA mismatch repair protein MutS [Chitinophagaceae bacterium]
MNTQDAAIQAYTSLAGNYRLRASSLKTRLGWLSLFRLVLFVLFIYLGYRSFVTGHTLLILATLVLLGGFVFLIRLYDRLQRQTGFYQALVKINLDEIRFLETGNSNYAAGKEYTDPHHNYSYDLDLFGDAGLFPYLNRCSTSFGKQALATSLLSPGTSAISERQEAIEELKGKLQFRQHLQGHGLLLDTRTREMKQLDAWLKSPASFTNKTLYYLLWLLPVATLGFLTHYLLTETDRSLNNFYTLFVLNLAAAAAFGGKISRHLSVSTSVNNILQQYSGQLSQVENEKFDSPLLQRLQRDLSSANGRTASASLGQLASLFNYLETIVNLVVSMLLNGLFLFHVHILFFLEKWKAREGGNVYQWLELLGEVEALNSFANLSFNNPDFCIPSLSATETLECREMGHPLIAPGKRIYNSLSFHDERFVILTGSNMSGKSTFLRTVGINLVLARAGSRVCAGELAFYPYSVHVSMRITDSLQDSESFFYAELKRLRAIITELEEGKKTFVILDEILRGTNSNDKHSGTIGLINKLVEAKATGIIATHDLTVSELKGVYPGYIGNQCFESEIVNDELLFDYKLKPGVCSRLSASFLMKKMGVID